MRAYSQPDECQGALPVRSVGPAQTCVGIGVEVSTVIELLLGGLLQFIGVNREARHCAKCVSAAQPVSTRSTRTNSRLAPTFEHLTLVKRVVRRRAFGLVEWVHGKLLL